MKTIRIILVVLGASFLVGCAATMATKTVTVTTFPDGKKETIEYKELTQTLSTSKTAPADDVVNTCGK